ncbi:diiron oxygenase [Gordonia sp. CPCC 205333]|uniref:diiron oxygenase n=1 Tax=Gordonia sp. CPCC 205333 TaxID=3140790 RepID=UPI003AF3D1A9
MDNNEDFSGDIPLTVDGGPVEYRSHIAERRYTAQRLLLSSANETYDGDLDVDWSAPADVDLDWLPPRLASLYGTTAWERMSAIQRRELGRHELVNFLNFGILAEGALTMLMFRNVAENPNLMDDYTRYSLKAIQEETRNSAMFSRLVNKADLPNNRGGAGAWALSKTILFMPSGFITAGMILLVQEAIHSFAVALASDPSLQPHVRQTMRIHEISDERHIEFSRMEFRAALADSSALSVLIGRHVLAVLAARLYPILLNGGVYRSVGISPRDGLRMARKDDQFRMRARAMTDSFVRFGIEQGIFGSVTERAILRLGRILPHPASMPRTVVD